MKLRYSSLLKIITKLYKIGNKLLVNNSLLGHLQSSNTNSQVIHCKRRTCNFYITIHENWFEKSWKLSMKESIIRVRVCECFFFVSDYLFITVSRYGSSWHVGSTSVASSYRAFSKEKIVAELGAYVGLNHVNITLRGNIIYIIHM